MALSRWAPPKNLPHEADNNCIVQKVDHRSYAVDRCPVIKKCRSRELRKGVFFQNCGCSRRNGLQYDCQRKECQSRPGCVAQPFAKCCPSLFGNRFENITMGKKTNPVGDTSIRLFNGGSCAIQYDPADPCTSTNMKNQCGPKHQCRVECAFR